MEISVKTNRGQEFIELNSILEEELARSGVKDGTMTVFIPHTTAGVTINENADPDVVRDMLNSFNKSFPVEDNYLHMEGNSHAHIKASLMGSSVNLIIKDGRLNLGIWQGVYFCEFDGPRLRKVLVKIIEG